MNNFDYTIEAYKSFDQAVKAIEEKSQEKGFKVLAVHDVSATLNEKGFKFDFLKIIEICNAKYAYEVLSKNINIALMLPCPITVYRKDNRTFISALKPKVMSEFYPESDIKSIADEVDKIIIDIVNESK